MLNQFADDVLEGRTAGGRPVVAPVVNEHAVRAAAGTTMAIGAVAFAYAYFEHRYWGLQVVASFLFVEFFVRVTAGISRSPVGLLAGWMTRRQPPDWVSAKPKRFAWMLGMALTGAMTIITNDGIRGWLPRSICLVCLALMWLESVLLLTAFAERGIAWHPDQLIHKLDPDRKVAVFSDGTQMPFDLFLGVPRHKVPSVVEESGLTVDGWVPVSPLTLETEFPGVYALGDVASVGTPKAGVFSEGQASVVASQIIARLRGTPGAITYDGKGTCYLEFGQNLVGRVNVTFLSGQAPFGDLEGPSELIAADKADFGTNRIQRWFDHHWDHDQRSAHSPRLSAGTSRHTGTATAIGAN